MQFGKDLIGYGVGLVPSFWIGPLTTGEPNRAVHIAFRPRTPERVMSPELR